MKTKLILLDMHGCVHHPFTFGNYDGKPHTTWVIQRNQLLLDAIIKSIQGKGYNKIILAYGTNAQDVSSDAANYCKGGSITKAIPLIQKYLAEKLGIEILFESFTMPDIYGLSAKQGTEEVRPLEKRNLTAGENFKAMCEAKPNIEYASWMFDDSKVSLIYAFAHRVAHLQSLGDDPEGEIDIDFYDDTILIHASLYDFFNQAPLFLPACEQLNLIQYNGRDLKLLYTIKGTGELDSHYDWTVRLFSAKSYYFYYGGDPEGRSIKTAEELQAYHEEYHYDKPSREMRMNGSRVDPREILDIRTHEISKLTSNPLLLQCAYISSGKPLAVQSIPKPYSDERILAPLQTPHVNPVELSQTPVKSTTDPIRTRPVAIRCIAQEIERLKNNSTKWYSFGNQKKIRLILKAVKKAQDSGCDPIHENQAVQKALDHHRYFGFFGCKKTTSRLNIEENYQKSPRL